MSDRESLTEPCSVGVAHTSAMSSPLFPRRMEYLRVCIFVLLAVGIVLSVLPHSVIFEAVVGNGSSHVHSSLPSTVLAEGTGSGVQSDDVDQNVWKVWGVDSSRGYRTGNERQDEALEPRRRTAYRRLESDDEEVLSVSDVQTTSTGDDSESFSFEEHPESITSEELSKALSLGKQSESTASEDQSKSLSVEEHSKPISSEDKSKVLSREEHSESTSADDHSESTSSGGTKSSSNENSVKNEKFSNVSASTPPPPPPHLVPSPSKKKNWKDIKVEEYMPLVDSVLSNIVSTRFQFVIKVLAMNNYDAIHRCLYSLQEAEYAGDEVDIHIYIDHFELSSAQERRRLLSEETGSRKGESVSNSKAERIKRMKERIRLKRGFNRGRMLEAEAWDEDKEDTPARLPDRLATGVEIAKTSNWSSVEERLEEAHRVLKYAESFEWKHGKKVIHYRTRRAGSQSQWMDAWWPSSDDEFALFLEDDAEVSPLFYRYARSLIATYYYNASHYDRLVYGISLQRPQIVLGRGGKPIKVDNRTRIFKYQMVGIWGQIFFPRPWKEFRQWYDSKKSHNVKPVVNGLLTTDWYSQHGENLFTPWLVKFVYSRGYLNMYTNFLRDRVLSVTHRDTGVKTKKYSGCDSVLIWENGTYDIDIWHMAANWNIKKYDFCFREVNAGRFANYTSSLEWVLWSASGGTKELLVLSIFGVPDVLVKNWLCALRKLGIENYMVVGDDPVLLEYLSRRGHAAMRFENKQKFAGNIEKEMGALSLILGKGYSMWVARADTIWLGNPMELVKTDEVDVMGVEDSKTSLFFVRSTSEVTKLWSVLVKGLSTEKDVNDTTWETWENARIKFVKACEENDAIRTKKLEDVTFLTDTEISEAHDEEGEGSANEKVLLLPELTSMRSYQIKEKLKPLDVWNLDGDWACATVVC